MKKSFRRYCIEKEKLMLKNKNVKNNEKWVQIYDAIVGEKSMPNNRR